MGYEMESDHIDTDNYIDKCSECGANVYMDGETDNQIGRCNQCGYHPNDDEFHANPFIPLNFNED